MQFLMAVLLLMASLFAGCVGRPGRAPYKQKSLMGRTQWEKTIEKNRLAICQQDDYLVITVYVPVENLDKFEEFDAYRDLLDMAFIDYLGLSEGGTFSCPGLETISDKNEGNGRITIFRIPIESLKVLKK